MKEREFEDGMLWWRSGHFSFEIIADHHLAAAELGTSRNYAEHCFARQFC
jgi:hypothetical protein